MRTCRTLEQTLRTHPIELDRTPIISRDSKILTMGSCFAMEVRNHLRRAGYRLLPDYDGISAELGSLLINYVPTQETIDSQLLWYNTYTIAQEFEKAVGDFVQADDDIWFSDRQQPVYQDPYRRLIFSDSSEKLVSAIRIIDESIKNAIKEADLIVITLGLTESWFQKSNDRAICAAPNYAGSIGMGKVRFRMTEYPENYANLENVITNARKINPDCQFVITVSPVALDKTAHKYDHLIANTESKTILRAVAGAISRKFDNIYYFPSFEWAMFSPDDEVFREDGRHVQKTFVSQIMQQFEQAFVE